MGSSFGNHPELAWETMFGLGIDLRLSDDAVGFLRMIATSGKRLAWLAITSKQLTVPVLQCLACLSPIEAIEFDNDEIDDKTLTSVLDSVTISFVNVADEDTAVRFRTIIDAIDSRTEVVVH